VIWVGFPVHLGYPLGTIWQGINSGDSVNLRLRLAIALKYQHEEDSAPRVTASAQGHQAEHLIRIADQNAIPVHEDSDLARALAPVPLGQAIPTELYSAVAEVLALLVRMDITLRNRTSNVNFASPT
jgi:flagellar biosynthesis protein